MPDRNSKEDKNPEMKMEFKNKLKEAKKDEALWSKLHMRDAALYYLCAHCSDVP